MPSLEKEPIDQALRDSGKEIRQKYAVERVSLNDCFAKDMSCDGVVLNKSTYRIARRKIVLLRQKELLEAGVLENDKMVDEKGKPTGTYELDWINEELLTGVKDKSLVCPHDLYPHNPYPEKVKING